MSERYLHGYTEQEQDRLERMNSLLNDRCLKKLSLGREKKVLDLGCGLGIFTRLMAAKISDGEVLGLEYDRRQISRARELAKQDGDQSNVRFYEGSIYTVAEIFPSQFDLIFVRFLLEHLADVRGALDQCYQALKPGGRLVVMDDDHGNFRISPEPSSFESLWKAYCRAFEEQGQDPYIGRHLVSHLFESGFSGIQLDFVRFGAAKEQKDFKLYSENLLGIIDGAVPDILEMEGWDLVRLNQAVTDLRRWQGAPDAALWYAANWVEGKR